MAPSHCSSSRRRARSSAASASRSRSVPVGPNSASRSTTRPVISAALQRTTARAAAGRRRIAATPGAAAVADADRRQHLADDHRRGLALDPPAGMVLLESHAVVEDDLDAAVRDDRFRRAGSLALEDPETVHHGCQARGRRVLGVAHGTGSIPVAGRAASEITSGYVTSAHPRHHPPAVPRPRHAARRRAARPDASAGRSRTTASRGPGRRSTR